MEYGEHGSQSEGSWGYVSGHSTIASSPRNSSTSSSSTSNACTYCYERKRRCVSEGNASCHRCRISGQQCVPRQPTPRTRTQAGRLSEDSVVADLEEINEEIDRVLEQYIRISVSRRTYWEIQEVLEQLANIPPTYVATDLARAEFARQASSPTQGEEYWQEGPSSNLVLRGLINERGRVPDILLTRIIEPREANELFERFMQFWNHGLGLLDPAIHSPRTLLQRCPLLFTVVLTIASRDYPARPSLHDRLSQQAKLSASAALTDGLKSADTVQALLLMAAYPPPVQRFTDDRTSLFVGMALRMAIDLSLHLVSRQTPRNNAEALELANHTRTWSACLLLDSWNVVKHGRLPTLREPEHEIRVQDVRSLQTEFERRIFKAVNEFMQFAKAGNAMDYMDLTRHFNVDIRALREEVQHTFRHADDRDQPSGLLRIAILNQTIEYARMIVYSFGFTKALQQGNYWGGDYSLMCLDAATSSVRGALEHLAPLQLYKYSPDAWFEYAAFSAAFLLKLLRPQFQECVDASQRVRIVDLIKRLVDMYRSPAVALQVDNHLPRVLAQFLENAARHLPEYAATAGSRGLSRNSRNTPSPPRAQNSEGGFNVSPGEALMAAVSSAVPDWWEQVNLILPGL